jgi:hypothetical protein
VKTWLRSVLEPESSAWRINLTAVALVVTVHAAITDRLHDPVRTGLLVLCMAGIVSQAAWLQGWRFWAVIAAILAAQAAALPLTVPNHHYALTWTTFAIALTLSAEESEREELARQAAAWIIVAIMTLATAHRLASPAFMDGSYLGYMLATGGFLKPILSVCDGCVTAAQANQALVADLRAAVPSTGEGVTLQPLPHLPNLVVATRGFGTAILAIEASVAILFLLRRNHRLAHWSLLFFAATLGVIRQELLFISVVSMLGLLSCPTHLAWERRAYTLAVVVFAAGALG